MPGYPAFTNIDTAGYYQGGFQGKKYRAHRVVYFLVHGEWPAVVDHLAAAL
ncbi:hypothetical protein Ep4_011 [Pseudomonas phage Ep4]|uniref:Uncharacterized protein n=1 Tax=Pseudomonas phage Ep4 TaxID=3057492 RepID=A0AAU9E6T7_9CAUD|nr:hypothetical protein Ep4_011 [Pseudomonas phage Ep4]